MFLLNENSNDNTLLTQEGDNTPMFFEKKTENRHDEAKKMSSDNNRIDNLTHSLIEEEQSVHPPADTSQAVTDSPKRKRKRRKSKEDDNSNNEPSKVNSFKKQFILPQMNPIPTFPKSNFRLEDYRLTSEMYPELEIVEVPSAYEVRKPGKHEFVRMNPDPKNQCFVGVIKEKTGMNEKLWLVAGPVVKECPGEITGINLRVAINRMGQIFIWPLSYDTSNSWNQSALQGAEQAKTHWVRLKSNKDEGKYQIMVAKGELPDPIWPDFDLGEMITLAFGDRIIADLNHPVLQKLRGEI